MARAVVADSARESTNQANAGGPVEPSVLFTGIIQWAG